MFECLQNAEYKVYKLFFPFLYISRILYLHKNIITTFLETLLPNVCQLHLLKILGDCFYIGLNLESDCSIINVTRKTVRRNNFVSDLDLHFHLYLKFIIAQNSNKIIAEYSNKIFKHFKLKNIQFKNHQSKTVAILNMICC